MRDLLKRSQKGLLITAFLTAVPSVASSVSATLNVSSCPTKERIKKGPWKNTKALPRGTKVRGRLIGKRKDTFVYAAPGSKNLLSSPAKCFKFDPLTAKKPAPPKKTSPTDSDQAKKTVFTVMFSPQYLGVKFKLEPESASVDSHDVSGKIIGAGVGVGIIYRLSSFQVGGSINFGAGSGFATLDSSDYEYSVKFARGFYILAPVEIYYGGRSSFGVGVGLQYLKIDWPVVAGEGFESTPDTRTSYMMDIGYRYLSPGFVLNPRIGLLGGGSLFASVSVGFAF